MKKEYVVIGLGRFGGSVCRELLDLGMDVMVVDKDEDRVNQFARIATHAVIADTTDEDVLKNLGIRNFSHVIVAIGENIQASILTTLMLKEMGIANVTVKAQNDYHEKVLRKIGADHVVHPERDMGRRIAHHMVSDNVLDYLELSDEYSIAEVATGDAIAGRSILDLNIRAKYGLNVVAIKKEKGIIVSPQPDEEINSQDILVVIGADTDIKRFERKLHR